MGDAACLLFFDGERAVFAARFAEFEHGALQAEWSTRCADGSAELHHGLVVIAGSGGAFGAGFSLGHERLRDVRDAGAAGGGFFFGVAGDAEEYALDVAVDYGDVFAEGDAGDGGGGVVADAGEGAEFVRGFGELAAELADHELCGAVEHARAAVVAEAAPESEDGVFRRFGEGFECGEAEEEFFVALGYGGDARLLQHDFGEPRGVRVVDAAPGERAGVFAVPEGEAVAEIGERGAGELGDGFLSGDARGFIAR